MSDSARPHRRQPTRLPRPWDSPGKNPGVGCHFLLQCMKVKSENEVAHSCPTLHDPTDCSPPGSSIHGIFQARVLEWGAIAFSEKWIADVPNFNMVKSAKHVLLRMDWNMILSHPTYHFLCCPLVSLFTRLLNWWMYLILLGLTETFKSRNLWKMCRW